MFSVHTTYIPSIILGQWNNTIILAFSFSKSSFFIMFYGHTKHNAGVLGLKSVFEKIFFFRDGFLWTAGLAVKIMLHFDNYPALGGRCLRVSLFLTKTNPPKSHIFLRTKYNRSVKATKCTESNSYAKNHFLFFLFALKFNNGLSSMDGFTSTRIIK